MSFVEKCLYDTHKQGVACEHHCLSANECLQTQIDSHLLLSVDVCECHCLATFIHNIVIHMDYVFHTEVIEQHGHLLKKEPNPNKQDVSHASKSFQNQTQTDKKGNAIQQPPPQPLRMCGFADIDNC